MFAYKSLFDEMNANKKSAFYKILKNALYKFNTCEKVADKTYEIFLNNFKFQKEDFSLTDYEDFLSFMKGGIQARTKLYDIL